MQKLEEILSIKIDNPDFFKKALTHPSYTKEQDLPLNSTKISGACGRLMCCLRYEFEAYRDFKNRAPKRNAVIETPLGMAKIVEYNIKL